MFFLRSAEFDFKNLLVNDSGSLAKSLINENWKIMLDEMNGPICKNFADIYKDVLNSVFEKVPYNEFFVQ